MARRRLRRKSGQEGQNLQIRNKKMKTAQKRKSNEVKNSQQPPRKRMRTRRYGLGQSSSVVLVGEIPCCQCPEQQEKYTRLGLNTALFLKGSQRPRRKQSHISIVTISSGDEGTSEERTSEWINTLNENQQCCEAEPDHLSDVSSVCLQQEGVVSVSEELTSQITPLHISEQTFLPVCASTPNKEAEGSSITESSTGCQHDKVNEAMRIGDSDSTSLEKRANNGNDDLETLKPVDKPVTKGPEFYFGSSSVSRNFSINPTFPFNSYFNTTMETSPSDGYKCPTVMTCSVSEEASIEETNQFDTNSSILASMEEESNDQYSDTD